MATTYDILVYNNDTYPGANFTITVNSVALDLTGAAIKMEVRKTRDDSPIITLETGSGLTIVGDPTNGQFKIDEQIISGTPGLYLYDIEITLSDGRVKTYIKGKFTITGDITHA